MSTPLQVTCRKYTIAVASRNYSQHQQITTKHSYLLALDKIIDKGISKESLWDHNMKWENGVILKVGVYMGEMRIDVCEPCKEKLQGEILYRML